MKMKNLSLENIAKACNGILFSNEESKNSIISGVVIDSRKVEKNYLFVAIKGERVDGHDYIDNVFEKGALCVISESKLETSKPYILVDSSLKALKDIAEFYLSGLNVLVVGITGSVGKTSTKEMIYSVLSEKYNVLKTEGNFNNEIGLPLTVFKIKEEHEIAILEMGISDFGEMTRLSKIAKPDVSVITNIGLCHLENLKTRDGILKAKTEMFNNLKKNGTIILNGDDDKLITVKEFNNIKPVFYGLDKKFNIFADNIIPNGIKGIACDLHCDGEVVNAKINIPGNHMVYNALAALCVGKHFNMSLLEISKGISKLQPITGRNNIMDVNGITLIDDCYNANPISMKSSIDVLQYANGRKVAILGDMFELGKNEANLHKEIGKYLLDKHIDVVILAGKLMMNAYLELDDIYENKVFYFDEVKDLISELKNILMKNDTVLVKASHGMHFNRIIEYLSGDFNAINC